MCSSQHDYKILRGFSLTKFDLDSSSWIEGEKEPVALDPIYPIHLVPRLEPTELYFFKVGFFDLRRRSYLLPFLPRSS